MLDFGTFNLPKCNISWKKTFKCRTKIVIFGYFWTGAQKASVLWYFTSAPPKFFQIQNFLNWVFWAGISKS